MLNWTDVIRMAGQGNPDPDHRVLKSKEEWRAQLTLEAYRVTREKGTEWAFGSGMCHLFEPGHYACVCCGTLLFDATETLDSGTGWPSFTQPFRQNAIAYHLNDSHGMRLLETTCNTCGAHVGHVFADGPKPIGLRYCVNAVALEKVRMQTGPVTEENKP